ncbi:hypothetical protein B0H13DRAFT_1852540 [Mycena leptocephala]|nr:hypothetical protein B0H13DRAFT_1852540 [Mycena leptocephala]
MYLYCNLRTHKEQPKKAHQPVSSTADVFPEFDASSHLELNDPGGLQFSARLQKIIPQSNNVQLDGTIVPNAFHGRAGFSEAHEKLLTLADSGLDGGNIPLQPLLVKARGIWAIIALDATADKEDNFADGTAMIAESKRRATCGRGRFFPVADLLMDIWGCRGPAGKPDSERRGGGTGVVRCCEPRTLPPTAAHRVPKKKHGRLRLLNVLGPLSLSFGLENELLARKEPESAQFCQPAWRHMSQSGIFLQLNVPPVNGSGKWSVDDVDDV